MVWLYGGEWSALLGGRGRGGGGEGEEEREGEGEGEREGKYTHCFTDDDFPLTPSPSRCCSAIF